MATPELTPTNNQGELESPWMPAPADSHVAAFKFLDRSGSEFGASSEVWVTFKGGKSPSKSYRYSFGSHSEARSVFEDLIGSTHPGEVVDARLKKPRVPYQGPFYV